MPLGSSQPPFPPPTPNPCRGAFIFFFFFFAVPLPPFRTSLECFRRVKTGGEGRAREAKIWENPGPRAETPPESPLMP